MNPSSHILTDIQRRLAEVRLLQLKVDAQSGALVFGLLLFVLLSAAGLGEMLFQLDKTGRTFLFVALLMLLFVFFARHLALPLLRLSGLLQAMSDRQIARQLGEFFPAIRDRLLNLLQLHQEIESGTSPYSPELVDASFQDLAEDIRSLNFTTSVDQSPVSRSLKLFSLAAAGSLLLFAGVSSALFDSFHRILHFRQDFEPPVEYIFEVWPGNKEIVKGESVEVRVNVKSNSIHRADYREIPLQFFWRFEGQTNVERTDLHSDSSASYRTAFQRIRGSIEYFVRLTDVESEHFKLTVIDRPVIRSLQVRLDFPKYSGLPSRVQDEFIGDLTALAGTRVALTGAASKEVREGALVFAHGITQPLTVRSQKFAADFTVLRETEYHVELHDTEDLTNLDPIRYQVKVIPDEAPTVAILQPGRNIDIAGDQFLRLLIQAKDDFGISSLRLGFRLIHSRYEPPKESYAFVSIPLPGERLGQFETAYTWDLSQLKLAPEDVVEYFAEVFDNDVVLGPKNGRTPLYLLRLPSLEEVFADLEKGHEKSVDDLKQTLDDAKQLKEKIESINQDIKKNKEMDWQQQKKLEEMGKKYQELQKKLENVQKDLDEMVQKMDEQRVLTKETLEKYMELQQLFEQLNSAELQQAMKQMQQAMQQVNREQLQQALQKMTFSEEQFRRSLERTIDLLKRIQIEQKLDEVRKRAAELERLQKDLKEQTAESENNKQKSDDLAKQQNDLARKQEEMQREALDLQKRMEEFFNEMPADKMQKLNERMQQQQLSERMQQASKQMSQGRMQQAQAMQQQVQEQLHEMTEELQSLQQEMLQQQMQHTLNELRRAINNILELSKREEALKQQSQSAPPNSPQLRQNAQDQMRVMQDMTNVINGLGELSKRSFAVTPQMAKAIGEAFSHMQSAMSGLDARNGYVASQEQGAAMGSLNKAAMEVQNAMEAMMQGGGSGGMGGLMQQLQRLAGRQQSINMQTLQMQQAAEAARLALEQEAVRKSLEQLNKEAQASGRQERILGDLDKIAQEMQEVVKNLEQSNVNPETLRKQERILSRLLDASKSMRERDFEKKRKAETGRDVTRRSPNELDPSTLEGKSKLQEDLLKAIEQGYSRDYQDLIRKYFEGLQKGGNR